MYYCSVRAARGEGSYGDGDNHESSGVLDGSLCLFAYALSPPCHRVSRPCMMAAWRLLLPGCQGGSVRLWVRQSTPALVTALPLSSKASASPAPLKVYVQQQPSRVAGKLRCPWASQVWPVQPSSARHEVGRPRDDARRGSESHEPGDMVPRADAKMQIPSCQMRFGAGLPGCFDRRWVRS